MTYYNTYITHVAVDPRGKLPLLKALGALDGFRGKGNRTYTMGNCGGRRPCIAGTRKRYYSHDNSGNRVEGIEGARTHYVRGGGRIVKVRIQTRSKNLK